MVRNDNDNTGKQAKGQKYAEKNKQKKMYIRTFTVIASSFQTTGPYGHGTIVHFWVRYDRWIKEVKTYLLQP